MPYCSRFLVELDLYSWSGGGGGGVFVVGNNTVSLFFFLDDMRWRFLFDKLHQFSVIDIEVKAGLRASRKRGL